MRTEREILDLMGSCLFKWVEAKAFVEYGIMVKPSRAEQIRSKLVGQRGYAHNLEDWQLFSKNDSASEYHARDMCRIIAFILGATYIDANFSPEVYITQHKDDLNPLLWEHVEALKLGAQYYLEKYHFLTTLYPTSKEEKKCP